MTSWLGPRSVDGGLDEIPLPQPAGRLWLCGKHVVGPDPEGALVRASGAGAIVCLNERHELADRYPAYVEWLTQEAARSHGRALWLSTPDLHAPDIAAATDLVIEIQARLDENQGVLIHCGAGIGRAPTVAALVLLGQGLTETEALARIGSHRPMAGPESGAQAALVSDFANQQQGSREGL